MSVRRSLLAGACLAVLIGLAVPVRAGATGTRAGGGGDDRAGSGAPAMVVTSQNLEVGPTGRFWVFLRVSSPPAGSDIAVDIYDPITDAAELVASTTATPANPRDTFDPFPLDQAPGPTVDTGFAISLYARGQPRPAGAGPWAYQLNEPGVYPIRVRLRDDQGAVLASLVTYLVRTPADTSGVVPARVALLTDVHHDALPVTSAEPVPLPASYLRRVQRVLDRFGSHRSLPASFVVTPETSMHLQVDEAGRRATRSLEAELQRPGRDLLGASFVDVDPTRLIANGIGDEVTRQAALGQQVLATTLGQVGTDTWVVDHHVDPAAIDALRQVGVAHLVLPPTAITNLQTAQPVLLPTAAGVNAVTSSVFELRGPTSSDPVLAGYQLLGRLAAVSTLTPNGAGVVVRIDPTSVDTRALDVVLDTLDAPAVYLDPATVTEIFRDVPTTTTPVAGLAPASTAGLGEYPDQLRSTNQMVASYGSLVGDTAATAARFDPQIAVSAEDRLDERQRLRILRRVQAQIQAEFDGITLPSRDHITLGARDARFPLSITSTGTGPKKVMVSFEASDRLSFPSERMEVDLTGERTTVQVPVRTRATGDTPLRITVRTPDGAVVLAESQYTIRSTAVSGVGLILTIGAGAFLALWWGRHWHRTRRDRQDGARPETGAATPGGSEPAVDVAPAPGQSAEDPSDDDDIFVDTSM